MTNRREFLALTALAFMAPLKSLENIPVPKKSELRRARVLQQPYPVTGTPSYTEMGFRDIKPGDVFQIIESDGTIFKADEIDHWICREAVTEVTLRDGSRTSAAVVDPWIPAKQELWTYEQPDGTSIEIEIGMQFKVKGATQELTDKGGKSA